MKKWIKSLLHRAGYDLFPHRKHYARDGLYTVHSDHFLRDPAFQKAYARGIAASAGVDPRFEWRVHIALWAAALAMRNLPGDFVECGVNAGFLSSAILEGLPWDRSDRKYYLVDTFEGPPLEQFSTAEIGKGRLMRAQEALAAGAYVTDFERVRRNFAQWPHAIVIRGRIPEILPSIPGGPLAFLHLDLNCAYPECAALEFFWDRLPTGGVVLLDDYAFLGHESQMEAMDDFARKAQVEILSLPTGQGLLLK